MKKLLTSALLLCFLSASLSAQETKLAATQSESMADDQVSVSQGFSLGKTLLRTNLLYWAAGMMNVGAEWHIEHTQFAAVIDCGYSFLGGTKWNSSLGGWFVTPELRYYLPENEQWFVGGLLLAGGYNIKLSDTGRQGSVLGIGAVGGYKMTLTEIFDIDFTLGLGYAHLRYDTYSHDQTTETNTYIEQGVVKNSFMPLQAGVNLIWKIK